ncbi:MAG: diadenosine tetraphosphatase [Gammaproteobacteria bacterium]|nr:MAG: diadenosine tetraphosphatase [Gammaproteobacteria bacterium]
MATYAIGDIQGCRVELEVLLELINFDPTADQLWFAGDLVNRGPDSLGALRLIHSLRDCSVIVLGNHDLHLLAVFEAGKNATQIKQNPKDNFYTILDAPDADQLLDWLRFRPLVHVKDDYLLVHAGVYPLWSRQEIIDYAGEVERVLRGKEYSEFFTQMYGNQPEKWSSDLTGNDRLRFITNSLTRMRYCYQDYSLDMLCKGPVSETPEDLIPWFKVKGRIKHQGYILHGHWAALIEKEPLAGIISLDTGCVWGNKLSAWCLEEKRWYSVAGYQK